jgi:hypothetical protein
MGPNTRVEIETTMADKKPVSKFFTVDKTSQEQFGRNSVAVERGRETFAQSKRKFIVGTWQSKKNGNCF